MATNFTPTDLQNLEAAIALGALRVQINGKEVIYQSVEQMLKAREMIRRQLGVVAGTQRISPTFDKGL